MGTVTLSVALLRMARLQNISSHDRSHISVCISFAYVCICIYVHNCIIQDIFRYALFFKGYFNTAWKQSLWKSLVWISSDVCTTNRLQTKKYSGTASVRCATHKPCWSCPDSPGAPTPLACGIPVPAWVTCSCLQLHHGHTCAWPFTLLVSSLTHRLTLWLDLDLPHPHRLTIIGLCLSP